jgi:dihydrofolate synthase/folylpolyglutamate synthase
MNYQEALDFWYGRINYEQRAPKPSDLKLDRMRALLERLDNPQDCLRIIHVAGSKGKGSTSAMLAAVLARAGYRTGLFTSPHLSHMEERFQIDGAAISQDDLTSLMEEICVAAAAPLAASSTAPLVAELTFFEIATALGFLHFARQRVELAVIEVGLGGRFDSTNVCRPLISLITSISLDHTQLLGNTVASIAREKAGIIKPKCVAISGATDQEARQVIAGICRERNAPLNQLGADFHYRYEPCRIDPGQDALPRPRVHVRSRKREWRDLELGLIGDHQGANAAVAAQCVECLTDLGMRIPEAAVRGGLAQVRWPARLEIMARRPLVVLDCAHNVASVQALVQTLLTSFPPSRRLLVFAVSADKDLAGILQVLAPHFEHAYLTRFQSNPRGAAPDQLAELWRSTGHLSCSVCPDPAEAWRSARAAAGPDDLVCITGSVFLAGELRPHLVPVKVESA